MTDDATSSGPLAGLRAIELGSTVAGPFCARLLADFGANRDTADHVTWGDARLVRK